MLKINLAHLNRYATVIIVTWTLIVAGSLTLDISNEREQTRKLAKKEAEANFNKDQSVRLWAASHGGVYVPPTGITPPNPYLSHVPDRDVRTTSGKSLTLMNPAYMIRQVMESYSQMYNIQGRITSLKALNPLNTPDEWEAAALKSFERGVKEVIELTRIKGEPYLRLMRPMITEKTCLKCHGFQGYREGDIRGGFGVSVPMQPYLAIEHEKISKLAFTHVIFWLLGLSGIGFVFYRSRHRIIEINHAENALRKSEARLAAAQRIARIGNWEWNIVTNELWWSDEIYRIFGLQPREFNATYEAFLERVHPDDRDIVRKAVEDALSRKHPYSIDHRIVRPDGSELFVHEYADAEFNESGQPVYMTGTVQDITERKKAENMLRNLADISDRTGIEYFQSIAAFIANELGTEYAIIGKLDEVRNKVKTITAYAHGKFIEDIEYDLRGTPCNNVMGNQACVYPENIRELFPEDTLLVDMKAESYAGIPLFASDGQPLGIIVTLGCRPMKENEKKSCISLLQIFSARVSSELERREAEENIKNNYQIQSVLNSLLHISLEDIPLEKQMEDALDLILSVPFLPLSPQAAIFLVEDNPDILVLNANRNLPAPLKDICAEVPVGKCFCGRAAERRQIEFTDCVDHHHDNTFDGMTPHGHYNVPILSKDRVLGVLALYLKEGHNRKIQEVEFLQAVSNTLAGIIERKKAEKALVESEERFKGIVDNINIGVSLINPHREIILANKRMKEWFPDIDFTNTPLCHLAFRHVPSEGACFKCPTSKTLHNGQVHEMSVDMQTGGETRNYRIVSSPIKDAEGNIISVVELLEDMTEHNKLEEQLLHAQKMESIGTLAGGVAHDFNNIITAITGFVSVLNRRMQEDDPLTVYVNQIQKAAENAANLTSSLLTFSRKQKMNPVVLDFNEVIRKMGKFLLRIIGENIEFRTILSDHHLNVRVDFSQMEQVLMNLAVNARDAMPGGGILTVSTEVTEIDSTFIKSHGYGNAGTYAVIAISDTGTGIDEKTKEKIFEPFFTTKEVGKGTGLGLSIVYGIIKQHNGYISVSSTPGEGTQFTIYLPLVKKTEEDTGEKQPAESLLLTGTETILLAEDDAMIRRIIESELAEYGYTVITAEDGEDAVSKFLEHRHAVQIFITDVIMPRQSGREAYEEIKKVCPDIKVLFLSGYTEELMNEPDDTDSNRAFMSKPVKPEKLLQKIREMLATND